MPRTPRSQLVDGLSHVTARGNRRGPVFSASLEYFEMLVRLGGLLEDTKARCLGFCLMPNHLHVVFDAEQPELSALMHRLLGGYARAFNRERGLTGHVFEGRFGSKPIVDEPHLLEVVRYVVLNPVRAGICKHPREWPWSSYAGYLDATARPAFLDADTVVDLFAGNRRELAAFVDDGLSAYPKPYVPANRSASRRTSSAAGSPTTFR